MRLRLDAALGGGWDAKVHMVSASYRLAIPTMRPQASRCSSMKAIKCGTGGAAFRLSKIS